MDPDGNPHPSAGNHTSLQGVQVSDADIKKIHARHRDLSEPDDEDERLNPLQHDEYIFPPPKVFSKQGLQTASLEVVGAAQATALPTMKDGADPSFTSQSGYPAFRLEDGATETINLSTESAEFLTKRVMEYVRPYVLPDPCLLWADDEIVDYFFSYQKLVGPRDGTRKAGLTVWAYSMFKGLRFLNLSATGGEDEPRRPTWISKTTFLGASQRHTTRMLEHLGAGKKALSNAGSEHRTDEGIQQSLTHALAVADAVFEECAVSLRSDDGEPQLKKSRKYLSEQTNPSVKVSSKSSSIIGPKMLNSILHGKRTTVRQLSAELESSGENPTLGALADLVGVRTSKVKMTVEKIRSVINAIATALGHVFPDFSVGSVAREWSVTFRASMGFYIAHSASARNRIRAIELYGQMHWFALIQYLSEMRDDELRATAQPVDFHPDPLAWAECCYKAEGYEEYPAEPAPMHAPQPARQQPRQTPPHQTQPGCNGGKQNRVSPNAQPRKVDDKTKSQTCKKAEAGQPCVFYDPSKLCCVFQH